MRTILTIDIGNTAMKACVYEDERLVQSVVGPGADPAAVDTLLAFNTVDGAAYCCVGRDDRGIACRLRGEHALPVVEVKADTPLPIGVDYGSRQTLGADRVAAAVGAFEPDSPALVVDAGTAVTIDLVADGRFRGGNISPGLRLRFRSLNAFTSRLPLVGPEGEIPEFGHDTLTAIRAGVVRGLVGELAEAYLTARSNYDDLKMILTGGDAGILQPMLAARGVPVTVDAEVVGRGLVRIFNYNN